MEIKTFEAISPIDGRYRKLVAHLSEYFSEGALMRARVEVEVEYFIFLTSIGLPELKDFPKGSLVDLRMLYVDFNEKDYLEIKEIERTTNHDVKAVEYFIRRNFDKFAIEEYAEFVHFGLTSQDVNNTALPLLLKRFLTDVYLPELKSIVDTLNHYSTEWAYPMMARTHGQPATPTTLGKEFRVFSYRIEHLIAQLEKVRHSGKFGGASGNLNAHYFAYPEHNWDRIADNFLQNIGLVRQTYTTQIENYDDLATICNLIKQINNVFIDLSRDVWQYVSLGYLKQRKVEGEVGSSAMPHKVNPIDFENAEGNFGVANALLTFMADKLPISRLQRDLTDSTVLRNLGMPFAHTAVAHKSLIKGLGKIFPDKQAIENDLLAHPEILAEAIQTYLRRIGYNNPYEALKSLTRGNTLSLDEIRSFIYTLDLTDEQRNYLLTLSPLAYIGNLPKV